MKLVRNCSSLKSNQVVDNNSGHKDDEASDSYRPTIGAFHADDSDFFYCRVIVDRLFSFCLELQHPLYIRKV